MMIEFNVLKKSFPFCLFKIEDYKSPFDGYDYNSIYIIIGFDKVNFGHYCINRNYWFTLDYEEKSYKFNTWLNNIICALICRSIY